ncbi:2-oxo-4-hydroxy-4-carboxy-5-ureidoimidazoline decarboxylase [Prauserella shujinwangii]|uniref:2-oxo-4-hydroxy-4-carboxy-5-ureidoimidazoline decarboxylase n=1 Tax=Prauserella shujinwangii TaxID=1453103 RepID=A0A2T0LWH1_9PSEU|nr:2-oxo-4-hydroxy-4-carboxy-5-ureidoimidazoline decarboxylase [Prauserella shujinwangii]PRX48373.1 2-oxo-4-hydroxy-4-carboxy-5-ureidoimidazoline decarboxylase [Prauserella shujinwangii]
MTELRLSEFNSADPGRIRPVLHECLPVPRWVDAVLTGRPYPDRDALLRAADLTLRADEIHAAMRAHPRIGERPASGPASTEQSGVDTEAAERFRAANAEYERRFGHVYLVCASGRTGDELLADLRARLGNDPGTELAVAGRELVRIARLRLERAVPA